MQEENLKVKNKKRKRLVKHKIINNIVPNNQDDDSIQLLIKNDDNDFENLEIASITEKQNHQGVLKLALNIWTVLLCIVFIATFIISTYHDKKIDPSNVKTTLILFSLDGFRREYLDRRKTPTLATIAELGISAEYMISQFPTETFPNHYSIITGLLPEYHGIVSNVFFDPSLNATFHYKDQACIKDVDSKWFKGEPLWVTANKNGHKTASLMWIGSEASIKGEKPNYVVPYKDMDLDEKVDAIFEWLELPAKDRPSFISVYIPDLDSTAHKYGPDSDEINRTLIEIDQMFSKFISKLEDSELINFIDIMVVSDHGMAKSDPSKALFVDDYIDMNKIDVFDTYPMASINPKNVSDINPIYDKLLNASKVGNETLYQVWLTDKNLTKDQKRLVPDRYHYSRLNNNRISPLILVPKPPYCWVVKNGFSEESYPRGIHGYENSLDDMKAIFLAKGPSFQKKVNYTLEPFSNTELYDVMCRILKIKPAPNNSTSNGRALFDKVLNI
ncbi:Phosphodiest-domain-containing protein [Anaeromyces robustus]|uniref:Phosphodiest-domain-containing protein n=1 Tax=Anaeromyces robustus TaxID=1754192 RepID=A0A1Y1X9C0_9FUNG|nr:Phosphodiest-domain-containing protein [Anaeromyces robustus]|eukprot:ORX82371.1 Phosphodiest-domain-containing protein [Anaeromyces robustus]